MLIQEYPVTELYGCQPGYPLNTNLCPPGQGFHKGIDYGCPSGTPIVVNGTTIGISGATGTVSGPHCHIGKWIGGKFQDPGVGNGFSFTHAVVTEVSQDAVNGKYVALDADGARWVYLHMSDNSKVSVGQALQGELMSTWNNGDTYNLLNTTVSTEVANKAKDANYEGYFGLQDGREFKQAFYEITTSLQYGQMVQAAQKPSNVEPYSGPQLFTKA